MKKIKDDYNTWAHQYDNNINTTRDLDKTVTKKSLSKIDFFKVLELGCGSGKNTEWLITKADRLIGLDFSKNMLDLAKNKIKSEMSSNVEEALKKISNNEKKLIVCFGSLYNCGNILNKN